MASREFSNCKRVSARLNTNWPSTDPPTRWGTRKSLEWRLDFVSHLPTHRSNFWKPPPPIRCYYPCPLMKINCTRTRGYNLRMPGHVLRAQTHLYSRAPPSADFQHYFASHGPPLLSKSLQMLLHSRPLARLERLGIPSGAPLVSHGAAGFY